MSINWRLASRLSVVTLALLVVLIVAVYSAHSLSSTPTTATGSNPVTSAGLQGTDLGGIPAPDFRLTDQFGHSVALSQFKGQPIVLTFLYTHCPDVCPLTAEKLHAVVQNLGTNAQHVTILAVSTDPVRDTLAAAQSFSQVHHMLNAWHYLIGRHDELVPVWSAYSVFAQPAVASATTPGTVTHTSAIFVIDKQGRERVFFGDGFTSDQLTADLKTLLRE